MPPDLLNRATDRRTENDRRFTRFAWITLAFTVAVAIEGAFVRATGSGAGCGNHWPLCNGQVVFGTPAMATVIEFAHRSMTGIDTFLVLGLFVWAFRVFPKDHLVRRGAALSAWFLFAEALIGAALVKFGLVVHDASPARAFVLSLHLVNTLTLIACLTLTALWSDGRARIHPRAVDWARIGGVVLLGITGTLTALADTLYPAKSLAAGFAQDLRADSNFTVKLRALHPFLAVGVALWLVIWAVSRFPVAPRLAPALIALIAGQLLAGALNLLLLAPVGIQLLHLLLADLIWIALIALSWSPSPTSDRASDLIASDRGSMLRP
jgi:heme A synthase